MTFCGLIESKLRRMISYLSIYFSYSYYYNNYQSNYYHLNIFFRKDVRGIPNSSLATSLYMTLQLYKTTKKEPHRKYARLNKTSNSASNFDRFSISFFIFWWHKTHLLFTVDILSSEYYQFLWIRIIRSLMSVSYLTLLKMRLSLPRYIWV